MPNKSRVEKTREQHEHARGTPMDLSRNTQAQKQRIKGLTIDTTNEYDRNKANLYKAGPWNKQK